MCDNPEKIRGVMIIVVGDTPSSVEINAGGRIGDPSKMAATQYVSSNTPISRSRHFEIESEAPVGRNPEVKVNNNDLDYQPRAATAI